MNSTTACLAAALVGKRSLKNDSATALSWQLPVRLRESLTSLSCAYSARSLLVYWAPRSAWNMALPAT